AARECDLRPGNATYTALVGACGKSRQREVAWRLFQQARADGLRCDLQLCSAAVSGACSEEHPERAWQLLGAMREQLLLPDLVTYNALISACGRAGDLEGALRLLRELRSRRLEPGLITYNALLGACDRAGDAERALRLHDDMLRLALTPDAVTCGALVGACGRGSQPLRALRLFDASRQRRVRPNVFTYGALIAACQRGSRTRVALKLFESMLDEQVSPDTVVFNSLIKARSRDGHPGGAAGLLEAMVRRRLRPDVVSFSTAIAACDVAGGASEALRIFDQMLSQDVPPNAVACNALISACEKGAEAAAALRVLEQMHVGRLSPSVVTYSAVISACEKGRRPEDAWRVFGEMRRQGVRPNLITCNALISACEKGAQWAQAVRAIDDMGRLGLQPSDVSYGAGVLACLAAGRAEAAFALLDRASAQLAELPAHLLGLLLPECDARGLRRGGGEPGDLLLALGRSVGLGAGPAAWRLLQCGRAPEAPPLLQAPRPPPPRSALPPCGVSRRILAACGAPVALAPVPPLRRPRRQPARGVEGALPSATGGAAAWRRWLRKTAELHAALTGEGGENFRHLRAKYPGVEFAVVGGGGAQPVGVEASGVAGGILERVSRDLTELVECACEVVAFALGCDDAELRRMLGGVAAEAQRQEHSPGEGPRREAGAAAPPLAAATLEAHARALAEAFVIEDGPASRVPKREAEESRAMALAEAFFSTGDSDERFAKRGAEGSRSPRTPPGEDPAGILPKRGTEAAHGRVFAGSFGEPACQGRAGGSCSSRALPGVEMAAAAPKLEAEGAHARAVGSCRLLMADLSAMITKREVDAKMPGLVDAFCSPLCGTDLADMQPSVVGPGGGADLTVFRLAGVAESSGESCADLAGFRLEGNSELLGEGCADLAGFRPVGVAESGGEGCCPEGNSELPGEVVADPAGFRIADPAGFRPAVASMAACRGHPLPVQAPTPCARAVAAGPGGGGRGGVMEVDVRSAAVAEPAALVEPQALRGLPEATEISDEEEVVVLRGCASPLAVAPGGVFAVRPPDQWHRWADPRWRAPAAPRGWQGMSSATAAGAAGRGGGPRSLRIFWDDLEVWRLPILHPCVVLGSTLEAAHVADLSDRSVQPQHAALLLRPDLRSFAVQPLGGPVLLFPPSAHPGVARALQKEGRSAPPETSGGAPAEADAGASPEALTPNRCCFRLAGSRLALFLDLLDAAAGEAPPRAAAAPRARPRGGRSRPPPAPGRAGGAPPPRAPAAPLWAEPVPLSMAREDPRPQESAYDLEADEELTPEQLERIRKNRAEARERKRKRVAPWHFDAILWPDG
ncbi:unnamed protein product, partial [Prorocentrum cordatum]